MTRDPIQNLGAHVASEQDALLEQAAPSDEARDFLARHVERRLQSPKPRAKRFMLTAAWLAPALIAVGVWFVPSWLPSGSSNSEPLKFTVGERPGVLHARESAPSDRSVSLDFSDGTSVELAPQARARVVAVEARGAEVVLESGRAWVHVVPNRQHQALYRVQTGPFVVEVKGTRFDVDWDPASEEFLLQLYQGRVSVEGCGFGVGREILPGQRVSASCRRPGFELRAIAETSTASPASSSPAPPATAPSQAVRSPADMTADTRAEAAPIVPRWQQLARQGHFLRAYGLAIQSDFEHQCARANVDDVVLLGDAARHAGHSNQARHAYASVRARAPATAAAANAAFALGRLAFDDDPGEAARWFDHYLKELPRGALAPAARDRLLEAAVREGDSKRLREIAERYLVESADGAHAERARVIIGRVESKP